MSKIQVLRWKSVGLRCPDHEFSFEDGSNGVRPITLIQMPNGTGKTTTLKLIRAALSGDGADNSWDASKVRSFAKRNPAQPSGEFLIQISINGVRYTIKMAFDFDEGQVNFSTTGASGISGGFNIPAQVKGFLRPEFVPYFIFDGELAESLLDAQHTNAQEVIEGLFRLDLFEAIKIRVHDFWDSKTNQRGAADTHGLTRRRNRLEKLRQRLDSLRREQKKAQEALISARDSLRKKKAKFQSAIAEKEEFRVQMINANSAVERARNLVSNASRTAFSRIRDPHAVSSIFATELLTFKQSLDRVKLPESTAREFFEELADETVCICGRHLDDATRQAIRDRAKQYLGSDDVALLNCIKGDIGAAVGENTERASSELTRNISELKLALREQGERELERDQIQQRAVDENPALEIVTQEISALEVRVDQLESEVEKFDNPTDGQLNDDQVFGIKVIERRISDAERKFAEITETLQLKEKRDILNRILDKAGQLARTGVCEEVCLESNRRIKELIPDNRISIERIERSLHLEGQAGGSVGETLSVAYAFLSSLFSRADNILPFIVDSPANPIDLRVRNNVAELIPKLSHQFIAFTISSEREGFLAPLEKSTTKEIQYFTLFRLGDQGAPSEGTAKEGKIIKTLDGVVVTGRPFFHAFHIEQEVNYGQ